mmetsp:Transcript_44141/g.93969  ORF Transcript_44141/g.93969 Transcript_44141/m.93969 type:complete len:326 (+) Transcript_44141:1216-2193(+)
MLCRLDDRRERADGTAADLPVLVVLFIGHVIIVRVLILLRVFLRFLLILIHGLAVFAVILIAVRIIGIKPHVSQARVDDLVEVRLDQGRAPQYERLKAGEAALPQLDLHRCRGLLADALHVLRAVPPRIVAFVVLVVPRDGVLRVAEAQKDGHDAVDVALVQPMAHSPGNGAHGPDQGSRVGRAEVGRRQGPLVVSTVRLPRALLPRPPQPLGLVDLVEDALHEAVEEGVRDDCRKDANGSASSLPHDGAGGGELGQSHVEQRLVLQGDAVGSGPEPREEVGEDVEARQDDLLRVLVIGAAAHTTHRRGGFAPILGGGVCVDSVD